jgi:hypothetical protein
VLLRKQGARILTFILAVLVILWGLLSLGALGTPVIPFAAAQILYGILAFVILIKKGGEFSRHRGLGANDLLTFHPGDEE